MKFCFNKLGIPVIGEVQNPGKLEGGDFFPLGKDFCMVGVGMISFSLPFMAKPNIAYLRIEVQYACYTASNGKRLLRYYKSCRR